MPPVDRRTFGAIPFALVAGGAHAATGPGPVHHYRSTAQGALGITGRCLDRGSDDFLVVGAHPDGQHWDVCRAAPDAAAVARMAALPFPRTDPIGGVDGALPTLWL